MIDPLYLWVIKMLQHDANSEPLNIIHLRLADKGVQIDGVILAIGSLPEALLVLYIERGSEREGRGIDGEGSGE